LIKQNNLHEKVYEFLQENNIKKINKGPHWQIPKANSTSATKMWKHNWKKGTQISDEHKTKSTTTECIYKNA
jgi:hypothetical protein